MSVYDLSLVNLDGTPMPSDRLKGGVTLFVNVASRCGLTPQYAALQTLHETWAHRGFAVVGVPCNQFGAQEPGTPAQIADFCGMNYGVTFPLLDKQDVNGAGRSPLYRALIDGDAGGSADIGWNFEKFLVGRRGTVLARFSPTTAPEDPGLATTLEAALT